MKKNRIIITILILLIIIAVVIVVLRLNKKSPDYQEEMENIAQQEEQPQVDLEKIVEEYQIGLKQIIEEYILADANITADDYALKAENIKNTLEKIMNLTLTKEFKESHLELVLALDDLRQAYEGGKDVMVREAEEKLNKVIH